MAYTLQKLSLILLLLLLIVGQRDWVAVEETSCTHMLAWTQNAGSPPTPPPPSSPTSPPAPAPTPASTASASTGSPDHWGWQLFLPAIKLNGAARVLMKPIVWGVRGLCKKGRELKEWNRELEREVPDLDRNAFFVESTFYRIDHTEGWLDNIADERR